MPFDFLETRICYTLLYDTNFPKYKIVGTVMLLIVGFWGQDVIANFKA